VVTKSGAFINTAKLSVFKSVFIPILTYGHESWVVTERIPSLVQAAEVEFLPRVQGVILRDKVRSCEIFKALNVESPLESRKSSYVGSVMLPKCPRKVQGSPAGHTHGKELDQSTGGMTTSPISRVPVLVWSQHNYLRLLLNL